jgi:hypothetical protein
MNVPGQGVKTFGGGLAPSQASGQTASTQSGNHAAYETQDLHVPGSPASPPALGTLATPPMPPALNGNPAGAVRVACCRCCNI